MILVLLTLSILFPTNILMISRFVEYTSTSFNHSSNLLNESRLLVSYTKERENENYRVCNCNQSKQTIDISAQKTANTGSIILDYLFTNEHWLVARNFDLNNGQKCSFKYSSYLRYNLVHHDNNLVLKF